MWGCFCVLRFAFGVWRFALRHVILMAFRRGTVINRVLVG